MVVASGSDEPEKDLASVEIIEEINSIACVPVLEVDELPDARYRALMKRYRERINVEVKK